MKSKYWVYLGFAAVFMMLIPFIYLGTDSIITYHDQLDGEMNVYILRAKYFFTAPEHGILPEVMGGVAKSAMTPPAPFSVLFFLSGYYFEALVLMQMIGSLIGYLGMYLLTEMLTKNKLAAALTGVMFAYLPLLPVYGLSHFGIPLLIYLFLQLKEGRLFKTSLLYTIFFALNSSLVLIGFALVGFIPFGILYVHKKGGDFGKMIIAWVVMLTAYLLTNLDLIGQTLGLSTLPRSHKSDYIYQAENFWRILLDGFLNGRDHSLSYHKYFLAAVIFILIIYGIFRPKNSAKQNLYKIMVFLLTFNFILALIAAFWNGAPGIGLRTRIDIFGTFQLARVMWISPATWFLLMGLTIAFVLLPDEQRNSKVIWVKAVSTAIVAIACIITGVTILMAGNFRLNIQKMINPAYGAISYRDYYAIGVFEQVESYIREQTGMAQDEYRVVSLGINPAAALYHGFYCLDGYSNNYPLEYKYLFRRIIAPELLKDEINRIYFDYWGNRCYLTSAENDGRWPIKKDTFIYQSFAIDTDALKDMGGKYLFSAAYIENAEQIGLKLAGEEAFETSDSYSRIYLYEVR